MAKFCGNCGAQMDDSAKVCGNCGTPFSGSAVGVKFEAPEKKAQTQQQRSKMLKLGAAAVAAVLVLILVISLIVSNTGYNGLLKKIMTAYKDYDIDALVEMSSDVYFYGSSDYADNYFANAVGYVLDSLEADVGHKYKLSYEVIETYELTNRKLDSLMDALSAQFPDFETSEVDQVVAAQVEITAKQGNKSASMMITVVMSKESGDWKLLQIN